MDDLINEWWGILFQSISDPLHFQRVTYASLLPAAYPVPVARFNEYAGTCDLAGLLLHDVGGKAFHHSRFICCFGFQLPTKPFGSTHGRRSCCTVSMNFITVLIMENNVREEEQKCQGTWWNRMAQAFWTPSQCISATVSPPETVSPRFRWNWGAVPGNSHGRLRQCRRRPQPAAIAVCCLVFMASARAELMSLAKQNRATIVP